MQKLSFPFDTPPPLGEPTEIAPGIRWLRMPLPWSLDHINLYLLADLDGWTLVDTGFCCPQSQKLWEPLISEGIDGNPITRILVTHHHPDHIGAANWLSERLGAFVWMHPNEYKAASNLYLKTELDTQASFEELYRPLGLSFKEAERLIKVYLSWDTMGITLPDIYQKLYRGHLLKIDGTTWQLNYSEGHSPGQVAPYSPINKVLISGDMVLPGISSNISVTPWNPQRNPLAAEIHGLQRMRELPEKTLVLPAHELPFRGLHTRLDQLNSGWLKRLVAIKQCCRQPKRTTELVPLIFREGLNEIDHALALGETLSYLSYLLDKEELLRIHDSDGGCRFVTA